MANASTLISETFWFTHPAPKPTCVDAYFLLQGDFIKVGHMLVMAEIKPVLINSPIPRKIFIHINMVQYLV